MAEEGKKKDPNYVPNTFIRQEKLCIKFQDGKCAETDDHPLGSVTLVHACGLCLFKKRGVQKTHCKKECPKRDKSF